MTTKGRILRKGTSLKFIDSFKTARIGAGRTGKIRMMTTGQSQLRAIGKEVHTRAKMEPRCWSMRLRTGLLTNGISPEQLTFSEIRLGKQRQVVAQTRRSHL